jgi:diaminohydroxyphosphoribosylaminopyrimidine deaminase / 5-amino-6-(5-phosphoribosylamino)uracil reductase
MTIEEKIMKRCIELAKRGTGFVSPNPLVGCVLLKDRKIVADGYHKKFGEEHAEKIAIKKAINEGISLQDCELYVNLEPCTHYGKTPPCTDLILNNKIPKVNIGILDPNPLVNGNGVKILKSKGIKVKSGILSDECNELNKFFIKTITKGLPYITLKIAKSADGYIADNTGKSKWISSIKSREYVHKLRNEYDAVLIGRKTLEKDNPELTVRHIKGRNPYRIIIDSKLKSSLKFKVFQDKFKNKTIIITSCVDENKLKIFNDAGIKVIKVKPKGNKILLKSGLRQLTKLGISSILIEGGAITANEFLSQNLADELYIFTSPKLLKSGIKFLNENNQNNLKYFNEVNSLKFNKDILKIYKKTK